MDNLLGFQKGWLNAERCLFLLGVVALLMGAFSRMTASVDGQITEKPLFAKAADLDAPSFKAFDNSLYGKDAFTWDAKGKVPFFVLEAPQIDVPAPDAPGGDVPLFAPPPFPQPGPKGTVTPKEKKR
ncbi:MAG: hypothetical protein WC712_07140 [Candidatus Brocadiia bacterium]